MINDSRAWWQSPLCSHFVLVSFTQFLFLFVSPGSTDHESGKFLLWRNAELRHFPEAARSCSVVTVQRTWSLFVFSVLNILPAPSYYWYEVMGVGEMMVILRPCVLMTLGWPQGSWLLEETLVEPLTLRTRAEGKNNLVNHSLLFFCTNSWTRLTRRCESV